MKEGTREEISDFLMKLKTSSREEMILQEKLREKEYKMRNISDSETQKTNQLLKNSQIKIKINGKRLNYLTSFNSKRFN